MAIDLHVLSPAELAERKAENRDYSRKHPERGRVYALAGDWLVYEDETASDWRRYAANLEGQGAVKLAAENLEVADALERAGR